MARRWTVYLVIWGFLAGLGLCLITDLNDTHHSAGPPLTLTYTNQACDISVLPCEDLFGSNTLRLASSLDTEQTSLYEGISLRPPFPPPRA